MRVKLWIRGCSDEEPLGLLKAWILGSCNQSIVTCAHGSVDPLVTDPWSLRPWMHGIPPSMDHDDIFRFECIRTATTATSHDVKPWFRDIGGDVARLEGDIRNPLVPQRATSPEASGHVADDIADHA